MPHRCPFGGLSGFSPISRSPDGLLRPAQSFLPERLRELRLRRQPHGNRDCALLHGSAKLTGAAGPCQNGNLSTGRIAQETAGASVAPIQCVERSLSGRWPITFSASESSRRDL